MDAGGNFPDALAGSSLVGKALTVMLLADEGYLDVLGVLFNNAGGITGIRFLSVDQAVTPAVREVATKAAGL